MINYGNPPTLLGQMSLEPSEMMFMMYLPVKLADSLVVEIPPNLMYARPAIARAIADASDTLNIRDHYIYVTAKTLYVNGSYSGNRPGWHADGFGSHGDLNYVWYGMNPSEFAVQDFSDIPEDDFESMRAMEAQIDPTKIVTYPLRHLLRLDESVVHRVNPVVQSGLRTFIKISISKNQFNLKGNAHNYGLNYDWKMHDRDVVRNLDNKDFAK